MISVELTEEELHKIEVIRNALVGNTIACRVNTKDGCLLKKYKISIDQPKLDQSDNIETKNVYYFSDETKIDVLLNASCMYVISIRFERSELENVDDSLKFSDLKMEPEYTNSIAIKVRSIGETALDTF